MVASKTIMAKLKEADDYEELNENQKRMVDLRAKYPNLKATQIPKLIEGVKDDSTYQYQVFREHEDIIEERREHFKETGEFDESVTELEIPEEKEKDDLDALAEEAEEPGQDRDRGQERTEMQKGNVSFEGTPLDATSEGFQGIQDRPVKEKLFSCTCGALFDTWAKYEKHLESCEGEVDGIPTRQLEMDIHSISEILSSEMLSDKVKMNIISQLLGPQSEE